MSDVQAQSLDRGTFDLLRERLRGHGRELATRVEQLNTARKTTFGSVEPELIATERVSTEHNCVPRDIAAVGETLLFGYNVRFGLKSERSPADAFAAYTFSEGRFHSRPLDLLADVAFEKDFKDVFRFYKDASFEKFVSRGPLLYIQLRIGPDDADVKTFKWAHFDGGLRYVDNRSDHELRLSPQHEFEWRRPRREDHIQGRHPHINIADKLFVETIGGDLTIKIENNTDSGEGIYTEPVVNADQTLDDAEIHFALLDSLVLLRIRPYQEATFRHIVFCEKTRRAMRVDGVAECCRLLPADQGILFPSGYLLHTGDGKTFDGVPIGAKFEQRIDSPNGEDSLYVFYHRSEGLYVLIRYNLIAQAADPPLLCHGFTLFAGGELLCFRAQPEPQRHHAIQIWRTPFTAEARLTEADSSSELFKIGNREIVGGLSECREILALLDKEASYGDLYADVAKRAGDLLDSYYWIRSPGTFRLDVPLEQIRSAAAAAIEEHEKVALAKESAQQQQDALAKHVQEAIAAAGRWRFDSVADFTETLARLRTLRGETVGLREVRYADPNALDAQEETLKAEAERIAGRCVNFLDREEALAPFGVALEAERSRLDEIRTAQDAKDSDERVAKTAGDLELLIETVANLPIEDATQRTRVVDAISAVFATVNALRAEIRNRRNELARKEGAAEFGSQLKLLSQAVVNALDRCDSPQKCDEQLSRVLLQVEELEGRFAEFAEFAIALAEKRNEVASAFETRKTALVEARAKRADALASAAERLLGGIASRSKTLDSADTIHGYFAGDLTISKVRELAAQLTELGDAARADGLITKLKSLHDDAVRQLKDRKELFAEGPGVINLGGYRFSVNTQPITLTTVIRDGRPHLHLTGTQFYEPVDAAALVEARDCWDQEYLSETSAVYRSEYLAYSLFEQERQTGGLERLASLAPNTLAKWVGEQAAPRYAEGYLKGVHDRDAAKILKTLVKLDAELGPLRASPAARTLARLFWHHGGSSRAKTQLQRRLESLRELAAVWPDRLDVTSIQADCAALLGRFIERADICDAVDIESAAAFLVERLLADKPLPVSQSAADLASRFRHELTTRNADSRLMRALESAASDAVAQFTIARSWIAAYAADQTGIRESAVEEAAVLLMPNDAPCEPIAAEASRDLTKLLGEHPLITGGRYRLNYYDFMWRLAQHKREVVPRFRQYVTTKQETIAAARERLRLHEFKPQVMASFVRNGLIDSVYLPLIGANLAKQIGVAGEETRADRQGMLLLISPPGYGKTTLMEYMADRLGLVFLKINGPAIGHAVTSLDPAVAPNLAAREELQKLGLGFEMGDNVLIYVDDIQHCHPEFLQKFISLCDAQRKIEGVWRGEAKTYDFRGRKVAVVMAGNPYTESGEKFQIPDMLANRADIYNLGDVTGRHRSAFELSFVENSLTSNATLSRLAGRSHDALGVLQLAEGKDPSTVTLEGNYSAGELDAMVAVMRLLQRVRDVVLTINAEYIRSAAQSDDYRTEPPFKLQGSYRNMNRIAERLLPVMNATELNELIWSSYRNDAQTLTTGAESNLLKFRELVGWLTEEETARWTEIKQTFRKNQKLHGIDDSDRFGQAIAQLALFAEGLSDLRETMSAGVERLADGHAKNAANDGSAEDVCERLGDLHKTLSAIAASLGTGLETLSNGRAPQTGEQRLTLDPDAIRQLIEVLRSRATDQHATAGGAEITHSASGSITVVNKIPPTLLNVLREQFRLMESWMLPVLTGSQRHSDEIAELNRQIQTCLSKYEHLVGRIEATRSNDGGQARG